MGYQTLGIINKGIEEEKKEGKKKEESSPIFLIDQKILSFIEKVKEERVLYDLNKKIEVAKEIEKLVENEDFQKNVEGLLKYYCELVREDREEGYKNEKGDYRYILRLVLSKACKKHGFVIADRIIKIIEELADLKKIYSLSGIILSGFGEGMHYKVAEDFLSKMKEIENKIKDKSKDEESLKGLEELLREIKLIVKAEKTREENFKI